MCVMFFKELFFNFLRTTADLRARYATLKLLLFQFYKKDARRTRLNAAEILL